MRRVKDTFQGFLQKRTSPVAKALKVDMPKFESWRDLRKHALRSNMGKARRQTSRQGQGSGCGESSMGYAVLVAGSVSSDHKESSERSAQVQAFVGTVQPLILHFGAL
jgi:hypothetical protein